MYVPTSEGRGGGLDRRDDGVHVQQECCPHRQEEGQGGWNNVAHGQVYAVYALLLLWFVDSSKSRRTSI